MADKESLINPGAAAKAADKTKAAIIAPVVTLTSALSHCEIVKGKNSNSQDDGGSVLHVGNVRVSLPLPLGGYFKAKIYMNTSGDGVVGFSASFPSQMVGKNRFAALFHEVPQDTRDGIAAFWQDWYGATSAEKRAAATTQAAERAPLVAAKAGIDVAALAGLAAKPKLVKPAANG